MSTTPLPLEVVLTLPPAPYALTTAGFMATLAEVETQIAALVVTTPETAQAIADELAAQAEALQAAAPEMEIMDCGGDEPNPVPAQKTETELAIETLRHAPVAVASRPSGITYRTTLVAVVLDVNKLPEVFIERTAKLAAIRSTFTAGWTEGKPIPVCAGVEFTIKREPVSNGR